MRLRFVTCNDDLSIAIRIREGAMARWVGFTPSHVEIVVPEGYLGAHYQGGILIRPVGYDRVTMTNELFVDAALPNEAKAETWARSKIGALYDWRAILDYLVPENWHQSGAFICSAFATGSLDKGGAFAYPLALPWHLVSPALLLLWLSGRTQISTKAA